MSEQSAPLHEVDVDDLTYRALQSKCKELGLPAKGKTEDLRSKLKQGVTTQQHAPNSAQHPAGNSLKIQSTTQKSHSSGDDTHTVLSNMDRKTEVGEALKPPLVTDTADSGKTHPHTSHGSPRKPDMLDAANATPLPPEREDLQPASSGQTSAAGKLGGDISDMSPTQLFQDDKPGPTQKQDQSVAESKSRQHWLRNQWPWLALLLLLSVVCWQLMRQPKSGSTWSRSGPKCNRLMQFGTLAHMLAHSDARTHLAEVWSGETADPTKAGGVLLACGDRNTSSAAAMAVATSLHPSCGHCLHHFDMPSLAGANSPAQGPELAGQAQKALVLLLQRCSHAVVIIEGMESMPPALLPVFINALSEHGHFEESGNQVPAVKALFIATVVMPTDTLQKGEEEAVASAVKQHLVSSLVDQGPSDAAANQAGALRRRFEHVALLS